jgi:Fungal Zn(2)-Cys(6) binuclear cluster domain
MMIAGRMKQDTFGSARRWLDCDPCYRETGEENAEQRQRRPQPWDTVAVLEAAAERLTELEMKMVSQSSREMAAQTSLQAADQAGGASTTATGSSSCVSTSVVIATAPPPPLCPPPTRRRFYSRKIACTVCHVAKVSCDGARPCSRCLRLGQNSNCVDRPSKLAAKQAKRIAGAEGVQSSTRTDRHSANARLPSPGVTCDATDSIAPLMRVVMIVMKWRRERRRE